LDIESFIAAVSFVQEGIKGPDTGSGQTHGLLHW